MQNDSVNSAYGTSMNAATMPSSNVPSEAEVSSASMKIRNGRILKTVRPHNVLNQIPIGGSRTARLSADSFSLLNPAGEPTGPNAVNITSGPVFVTEASEPVFLTVSSRAEGNELEIAGLPPTRDTSLYTQLANRFQNVRGKVSSGGYKQDGNSVSNSKTRTTLITDISHIELKCRSMRIGSYKVPTTHLAQPVIFEKDRLTITIPAVHDESNYVKLQILSHDILTFTGHLGKNMPAFFIQTTDECARFIRSQLKMSKDHAHYFDPQSPDESHKRIAVLPVMMEEVQQHFMRSYFLNRKWSEINHKTANMILVKSLPKSTGCCCEHSRMQ